MIKWLQWLDLIEKICSILGFILAAITFVQGTKPKKKKRRSKKKRRK